jgi:hypothetical protein
METLRLVREKQTGTGAAGRACARRRAPSRGRVTGRGRRLSGTNRGSAAQTADLRSRVAQRGLAAATKPARSPCPLPRAPERAKTGPSVSRLCSEAPCLAWPRCPAKDVAHESVVNRDAAVEKLLNLCVEIMLTAWFHYELLSDMPVQNVSRRVGKLPGIYLHQLGTAR